MKKILKIVAMIEKIMIAVTFAEANDRETALETLKEEDTNVDK